MKKILFVTVAMVLFATMSFAAPWVPTALELDCAETIEYAFDGSVVDITFDVVGKPARIYLVINTNLPMAERPVDLQNGHLGWHYVNRIDTTVYISAPFSKSTGLGQTTSWDGYGNERYLDSVNKNDELVPEGTYDYYLFGWDNVNPREKVCEFIPIGWYWAGDHTKVQELDEQQMPLVQPILYGQIPDMGSKNGPDGETYFPEMTHLKWTMGNDPDDISLVQTSFCADVKREVKAGGTGRDERGDYWTCAGPPCMDPYDFNTWYQIEANHETIRGRFHKYTYVEGGVMQRWQNWGGDDCEWAASYHKLYEEWTEGTNTDGDYFYHNSCGAYPLDYQYDYLWISTYDGEKFGNGRWLIEEAYEPTNYDPLQKNGCLSKQYVRFEMKGLQVAGASEGCFSHMVDCSRLTASLVDEPDEIWRNTNGDIIMDRNWDPDGEWKWDCNSKEPRNENGGRGDGYYITQNRFMIALWSYHGHDSFAVCTQDGSGMGYVAFADDAVSGGESQTKKGGGYICDSGSQYDGMLMIPAFDGNDGNVSRDGSTYWVPYDTCHGIITSEVGVEEEAVSAFSVAQNTPNPFNPTTTISYTLADAGDVTVDVYNVAGQKIDTLVNEFQTKGSHSIVWDASGFSAGVYFYTVKTVDFSKTMKMTLLK